MKKYTIVYSDYVYPNCDMTRYKHIETDNLAKVLKDINLRVWFVFDGWAKETKD